LPGSRKAKKRKRAGVGGLGFGPAALFCGFSLRGVHLLHLLVICVTAPRVIEPQTSKLYRDSKMSNHSPGQQFTSGREKEKVNARN